MQTCHTLSTVYQIYAFGGTVDGGTVVHQGGLALLIIVSRHLGVLFE